MNTHEHLRQDLLAIIPEKPLLLVLDFDGVITDDRVYVAEDGREMVACTRRDGMGTTLLRHAGFPVIILSTEKNPVVAARARKLQLECRQACEDKTLELERLLEERGIPAAQVIYVGNDVNDMGCLRRVGCGLAVADAHPMAKAAARAVLTHEGGRGAVREVAELILARLGREIIYNESDRRR